MSPHCGQRTSGNLKECMKTWGSPIDAVAEVRIEASVLRLVSALTRRSRLVGARVRRGPLIPARSSHHKVTTHAETCGERRSTGPSDTTSRDSFAVGDEDQRVYRREFRLELGRPVHRLREWHSGEQLQLSSHGAVDDLATGRPIDLVSEAIVDEDAVESRILPGLPSTEVVRVEMIRVVTVGKD